MGWTEAVALLTARGASLEPVDDEGQTPLRLAVDRKHPEVEAVLREAGATAMGADPPGEVLARNHWRSSSSSRKKSRGTCTGRRRTGDTDEVRRLLDAGADLEAHDNGRTPLMWAAQEGHAETVACSWTAGAAINAKTEKGGKVESGWTALMLALHHAHADVARLLLDAGRGRERGERGRAHGPDAAGRQAVDEAAAARGEGAGGQGRGGERTSRAGTGF